MFVITLGPAYAVGPYETAEAAANDADMFCLQGVWTVVECAHPSTLDPLRNRPSDSIPLPSPTEHHMARKPSVILTPAEKKEAVNVAKTTSKGFKSELATAEKARKDAIKAHEKNLKELNKTILNAQKNSTKADADLFKLAPPKAIPSPTE